MKDFFQYRESLTEAVSDDKKKLKSLEKELSVVSNGIIKSKDPKETRELKKKETQLGRQILALSKKIKNSSNNVKKSPPKKKPVAPKKKPVASNKLKKMGIEIEEYEDIWDDYVDMYAYGNRDVDEEEVEDVANVNFENEFKSSKVVGKIKNYVVRSGKVTSFLKSWTWTEKYIFFITKGNKLDKNSYVSTGNKEITKDDLPELEEILRKNRIIR